MFFIKLDKSQVKIAIEIHTCIHKYIYVYIHIHVCEIGYNHI